MKTPAYTIIFALECVMFEDVLLPIVHAAVFPDTYTISVFLLGISQLIPEYNVSPFRQCNWYVFDTSLVVPF